MAGSLDDVHVKIIGQDDYEYLIIRSDVLLLKFSPASTLDRAAVIRELTHLIETLEAGS